MASAIVTAGEEAMARWYLASHTLGAGRAPAPACAIVRSMNYLTVPQIAAMHGVTQGRIWQIAKERGIRPVGRLSRIALWTPAQARQLAPGSGPRGRGAAPVKKKAKAVGARAGGRSRGGRAAARGRTSGGRR